MRHTFCITPQRCCLAESFLFFSGDPAMSTPNTISNTALNGKVAVVTGAASGIGKEIAFTLSKSAAEIVKAGGKAIGVAMDVTNEDAVNAGIEKVVAELGSVDILVSNAGIQIV